MNQETNGKPIQELADDDEIDLIQLAKTLWDGRKTVIKITIIFMAIGLFVAIFSPKQYTASTTIVPATQGKSVGGNLSGLAAMAGINLGGMSSESGISPTLYPQITSSIPFQKELLQTPLTFKGQKAPITYEDYYTNYYSPGLLGYLKKYTIGLPGLLIKAIKSKSVIAKEERLKQSVNENQIQTITNEQYSLINQLSGQLSLDINAKDGYITVSTNMPEAIAAAELAQNAQQLLQQYIINFKVQKSTEQLKYINERYTEKELAFKVLQQQLARFKDQNKFVNSALAQTNLMRLQSEYDLAYGVYSELAKQLETQQLQVKEDTPVFTIIKPVSVPIERSKPKRSMILIIWTFLGGIIGVGMVFGRTFIADVKIKWNKEEV